MDNFHGHKKVHNFLVVENCKKSRKYIKKTNLKRFGKYEFYQAFPPKVVQADLKRYPGLHLNLMITFPDFSSGTLSIVGVTVAGAAADSDRIPLIKSVFKEII